MIKRLSIAICLLVVFAGAVWAQTPKNAVTSSTIAAEQDKKSLYARLGGYDAIALVVDDFITRLATDKRFEKFFTGFSDDSKKRLRQHILDQFCVAAGGPCAARDSEGHGTHTATTAAGDYVDHAPIFGIDRGPTSGIAPGAHVIAYRVCLEQGCFGSDSAAAVGQAISDGANVLNFSISGGRNPFTDPVELAFLDFYAAGGLANASAGNSGPGAATSDHAGPWENTVGANYPSRLYLTTLHLAASGGATADFTGSSITQPIASSTPVVMATAVSGHSTDATCTNAFSAGSVTGSSPVS